MPAIYHLQAAHPADLEERIGALWAHWRTPDRLTTPLWIVTPHYSQSAYWKQVLLRRGLPIFHAEFLTPGLLRTCLSEAWGLPTPPLRGREENLFLLQQLASGETTMSPMLRSLGRDARPLLQAIDQLAAAGHSWRALEPLLAPSTLLRAWEKITSPEKERDRARRDFSLREKARKTPGTIPGQILLVGFNLQHASLAALLEAALWAGEETALVHLNPLSQDEVAQLSWLGLVESWIPQALTRLPEEKNVEILVPPRQEQFYFVPHQAAQIKLAVQLAQQALSRATVTTRVALVVASDGSLASALAQALRAAALPFYTEFRTPLPLRYDQALLRQWLQLQEKGLYAGELLAFWRLVASRETFLRALEVSALSPAALEKFLVRAFQNSLEDRVEVAAHLSTPPCPGELTSFLQQWKQSWHWPNEAKLSEYLEKFETQIPLLLGPELGRQIQDFLRDQIQPVAALWLQPVTRSAAIRFFLAFVERPDPLPSGTPWSGLQLLSSDTARAQRWDEVILLGLNEGQWPQTSREIPLLPDSTRQALNRQAQVPSPQAEDETIYQAGSYPLLTDALSYHLARSHFHYLRETAPKLSYVAAAWDELEKQTSLHPSELFREAWIEANQQPWHDDLLAAFLEQTPAPAPPVVPENFLNPMLEARHARRDPHTPFGPFQFRLITPPTPPPLAAKAAEDLLHDPATQWFERWLKIPTERLHWLPDEVFALFQGTLLHHALSGGLPQARGELQPWPEPGLWIASSLRVLLNREKELRQAHNQAGVPLPSWWPSEWARLRYLVQALLDGVQALQPQLDCSFLASEVDLSHLSRGLQWRGQADLILTNAPRWKEVTRLAILDFKTGRGAEELRPSDLRQEADYFQLLAYADLVQHRLPRSQSVTAAVIHRHRQIDPVPVILDPQDSSWNPLWQVIQASWIQGCFGQALPVRDRFRPCSRLPLATLNIPENLLAAKWALTPELAVWERF